MLKLNVTPFASNLHWFEFTAGIYLSLQLRGNFLTLGVAGAPKTPLVLVSVRIKLNLLIWSGGAGSAWPAGPLKGPPSCSESLEISRF